MNPYNLCVLDNPRKLNAESPSKNCVSGMTPPAASRLNQPLLAMARYNYEEDGIKNDSNVTWMFEIVAAPAATNYVTTQTRFNNSQSWINNHFSISIMKLGAHIYTRNCGNEYIGKTYRSSIRLALLCAAACLECQILSAPSQVSAVHQAGSPAVAL